MTGALRETSRSQVNRAVLWAALAVTLSAGWQALTVSRNFAGNWTALFCTGQMQRIPPDLRKGTWVFANSPGYDGQMYRYVAHGPWLTGIDHRYLDEFSVRQRRILIPVLAWLISFGRQNRIDSSYIAVVWVFVFAGAYWTSRGMMLGGYSSRWGLLYLIIPSSLISADRLTIDVATVSLAAGLLFYFRQRNDLKLFVCASAICLSRETGFIILLGVTLNSLFARRWWTALLCLAAGVPATAWAGFVYLHRGNAAGRSLPGWIGETPLAGIVGSLTHPIPYPLPLVLQRVAQFFDAVAILGMILAFVLAVGYWWKNRIGAPELTGLLFVVFVPFASSQELWNSVYDYSRPFSPLLLSLVFCTSASRGRLGLAGLPTLLVLPRILLQLGPQAAAIFGLHLPP